VSFTLPLLFAFAPLVLAADPKPDPAHVETWNTYAAAMQKTCELLAAVKDEKTAVDAKPKLDKLHEEAREARRKLFNSIAELDMPEPQIAELFEGLRRAFRDVGDRLQAEFDRIGSTKDKAAYKALRETKLFTAMEKEYEDRAVRKAGTLRAVANTWSAKNEGKVPPKLEDLTEFLTEGKKGLMDPWGYPYQMVVAADKEGRKRLHIWTVSPYTGKKLGTPPPEVKDEKKDK
jgi:hypothetical protein